MHACKKFLFYDLWVLETRSKQRNVSPEKQTSHFPLVVLLLTNGSTVFFTCIHTLMLFWKSGSNPMPTAYSKPSETKRKYNLGGTIKRCIMLASDACPLPRWYTCMKWLANGTDISQRGRQWQRLAQSFQLNVLKWETLFYIDRFLVVWRKTIQEI